MASMSDDEVLDIHEGTPKSVRLTLGKSGKVEDQKEPNVPEGNLATDAEYSFIAPGRDYEPMNTTHVYTGQERKTLASYESLDYLPSHSDIYKNWIKKQKVSLFHLDVWFMMGLIGFYVGLLGFVLHQLIEKIASVKWEITQKYIDDSNFVVACLFAMGYGILFITFSAGIVIYLRPCAGGSGIQEVSGFLNGTNVRHILNIKTFIVKFFSCVTAVGCGFPVGPDEPMIHLGALVGGGVSQLRLETLGIKLPILEKFRTSESRRHFILAGAAAGLASAFGAPVGGLLFFMEEVSSFWTVTLSAQIIFCCIIASFTTDLFNSAFHDFRYTGSFGQFKTDRYNLFQIDKGVDVNIFMFIPTILIGLLGGLLGAGFTIINLKITRGRKILLHKIRRDWGQKLFKLLEPVVIMFIVTMFSILMPKVFSCTQFTCMQGPTGDPTYGCFNDTRNQLHVDSNVVKYTCMEGKPWQVDNHTFKTNASYNEVASLLFGTLEEAVTFLFSRDTHLEFNYAALFTVLPFFFFMVLWACTTAVSCGALVPMLMVGAVYGRIVGRLMVTMFGVHQEGYWEWMDPGAFALIGAASFFGGVTRLTLATTVIMMELTNDVQVLLPMMVSVMVSKWVGDFFTHPIYHALLENKCIPFLDAEPQVTVDKKNKWHYVQGKWIFSVMMVSVMVSKWVGDFFTHPIYHALLENKCIPFLDAEPQVTVDKKKLQLELYTAGDVMAHPVITLKCIEMVSILSDLLLNTSYGGFPVVKRGMDYEQHFFGLITRLELTVILMNEDLFVPVSEVEEIDSEFVSSQESHWIEFDQLNIHKLDNPEQTSEKLNKYIDEKKYKNLTLDLKPYINQSAMNIPEKFSLKRTYVLFRTLGLRHLTVTNSRNIVKGIITRKDLMGFSLQERLTEKINASGEMNHIAQPGNNVI